MIFRIIRTLLFLSVALPLAGCAVSPKPWTEAELSKLSTVNFERVTLGQEAVSGPISLYEAMARALKYNLDYRIELMQSALRKSETVYSTAQMLPQLTSNAGYTARDSFFQTTSLDIPTGIEVGPGQGIHSPNLVSQDKAYNDGDVTFSWNVLDFALSYVRARQAADTYLIAQETKRKTIQHIIEDTRTAYWRAVSCDRLARKLHKLELRVKKAIGNSRATAAAGAESPLTALTYERELVKIRQTAENIQHELSLARSQLAALIDVAPGSQFALVDENISAPTVVLGMSAEEMVAEAIFNRPEIREVAYQTRINEAEATAALLEVLPGLKLFGGDAFNDNHFLLHNNWMSWGMAASENLIKVVQLPAKRDAIDAQTAVLNQKALAVTMVVMTQVHVSRIRYRHYLEELATAKDYLKAQTELVRQLRAQQSAELIGEQTLIREEMNELVGEVQRDIAHGNVQNAASNLLVSMGLDVQARDVDLALDVGSLSSHLRHVLADHVALSDRAKYYAELERVREEARRKAAEEERRRQEEARRIAAEAQRVRAEQAKFAQADAQRVKEDAARAKREAIANAKADAQLAKDNAKSARKNAVSSRSKTAAERPVEWRWPWDVEPAAKDTKARSKKSDQYSGTK
jgi:outer membrane protein TolC